MVILAMHDGVTLLKNYRIRSSIYLSDMAGGGLVMHQMQNIERVVDSREAWET